MAKDQRAATTELSILQAATDLFLEQGYGETTLTDILTRAKISTGSFYHQFSGKSEVAEKLCVACLENQLTATRSAIPRATQNVELAEGVRSLIGGYLKWANEKYRIVLLIDMLLPQMSDEARDRIAEKLAAVDGEIAVSIRQWHKPDITREVPPRIISALVLGPTKELFLDWLRGMSDVHPSGYEDALVEAACAALSARGAVKPSAPIASRAKRAAVISKDGVDLFDTI